MKTRMLRSALVASLIGFGLTLSATPVSAQPAEEASDDTWVSVSGTVVTVTPDTFLLDYGEGMITVEMDDFDVFEEANTLFLNDQVVVYGVVDDDLFEMRTIEASSVYVDNLRTSFYANAADEEDFGAWTVAAPIVVGRAEVTGVVTEVTGREFTVATAGSAVTVDTLSMSYNPLDEVGFLQVDVGDMVKVGGPVDETLFGNHEINADWLIKLDS